MKLPERNSRGEAILKAFVEKPMTIYQGTEAHGNFATPRTPNGITHDKMVQLYCDLVDDGCLVREGILYRITLAAKYQLEKRYQPADDSKREVAAPRTNSFRESRTFAGYLPGCPWRIVL